MYPFHVFCQMTVRQLSNKLVFFFFGGGSQIKERLALDPFAYRPTAVRLLLNLALSQAQVSFTLRPGKLTIGFWVRRKLSF